MHNHASKAKQSFNRGTGWYRYISASEYKLYIQIPVKHGDTLVRIFEISIYFSSGILATPSLYGTFKFKKILSFLSEFVPRQYPLLLSLSYFLLCKHLFNCSDKYFLTVALRDLLDWVFYLKLLEALWVWLAVVP